MKLFNMSVRKWFSRIETINNCMPYTEIDEEKINEYDLVIRLLEDSTYKSRVSELNTLGG